MNNQLTSGKIRRSIQRFSDYASDLLRSDMNTFEDRIRMFFDFCSSDEVFSQIHQQLLSVPGADFEHWYSEMQAKFGTRRGQLLFPSEPEARMALMYQLLLRMREGRLNFHTFVITFFIISSNRISDYIYALNESVTQPLVRELGYRLQELAEQLPTEGGAPVSSSIVQIIHHATNVIQQHATGQNITQTATIRNPELAHLFEKLRQAVQNSGESPDKRSEAVDVVNSAEEAASAPKPRLPAIRALLSALPSTDTILSITSSILDLIAKST
jgi:hypothetical protein